MKNKRFLATVVATTLAATTMVMPVMAADGGSMDVNVTTKNAVIRVEVPTKMEISVNQFEMGDGGSQIYSTDFTMQNKSEIPVKVDVGSTAELKATTKLLGTKAAAGATTAATGEAWMAVAAKTGASSYADGTATTIGDLTESNRNVATFVQGTGSDAAKGTANQTFYLDKSGTMAYKLLNANEDASGIEYAQFYKLTDQIVADADALAALIADNDVYVAAGAAADGQTLTKVAKGGTHTYASGEIYYTAAIEATAKGSVVATDLYVYGDGTAATDGAAAFRYIGKLSGAQETWTKDDISKVTIKYDIVGVQESKYTTEKTNCTYGLYKEPSARPSIATTTYSVTADTAFDVTVSLGIGDLAATTVSSALLKGESSLELLDGSGTFATYADGKLTLTAALASFIVNNPTVTLDVRFDDGTVVTLDFTV